MHEHQATSPSSSDYCSMLFVAESDVLSGYDMFKHKHPVIAFTCRQHDIDMRIQCCCMAAECLSISNWCNHSRKDLTHVARIHRIPLSKACWADSIGYIRGSLLLSILLLPKPIQSTVTGTLQATCLAVGKVYVETTLFMYLYVVRTSSILRWQSTRMHVCPSPWHEHCLKRQRW